ncbi:MAG: energy transducer TonB [Pyrinomonadaceae bacterium]
MRNFDSPTLFLGMVLGALLCFSQPARAQDLTFNSQFSFEPALIDKGPELSALNIKFPNDARKNGIAGKVKVTMTLAEDGKIRNIVIVEDLPHGVGAAVRDAFEKMTFTPAMRAGKPVALNGSFIYEITAVYNEYDSNVSKVKLVGKPQAEYPAALRGEGRTGKVRVGVVFYADGRIKVLQADSTMPPEFDAAAKKAAETLKFQPAVHKKSKKPVTQTMWVIFEFKP